jgi:hypothetical protein
MYIGFMKDIHTVEPLVPEPSLVEVGIAVGKFEKLIIPSY